MAKSREELEAIKEKIASLKAELATLSDEEIEEISGGIPIQFLICPANPDRKDGSKSVLSSSIGKVM